MLLAIKDRIKGVLGIAVIVIISIPFALWGIQSYLEGDSDLFVAKINDAEISSQEFNRVLSNQRQALQKQYNGKIPFDDVLLKNLVLDQMINQRLLEEVTQQNGYRISDEMLFAEIQSNKSFAQDDVFNPEFYKYILAANGSSTTQYEGLLRAEMQVNQLKISLKQSEFITETESKTHAGLDQQKREFSYIVFNAKNSPSSKSITAEDIQKYYDMNANQFMTEEKVKIDFIEIKSKDFEAEVTVDESQIQEMYDTYLAEIAQQEERKARHILLTAKGADEKVKATELLLELKKQINDGASFVELAKKHSKDPGSAVEGGDLDWVSRDQMVKPFEEALFALKKGQVSEIVESQFGLHLIKLDDVRGKKAATLADKRDEFVAVLKADKIDNKFFDLADNLAAVAYENIDSLEIPAEILGLEIKTSEYLTKSKGEGIAQHEKVRDAVFSTAILESGENSDVIEVADGHVVVLRVSERVPAKLQPLKDVNDKIRSMLVYSNNQDSILAAANSAKEQVEKGVSLKDLAVKGLNLEQSGEVSRRDIKKVDYLILESGFKMAAPEKSKQSVEVIKTLSGDMALVVLDKVNIPSVSDENLLASSKSQLIDEYSQVELKALLASVKNKADIYRNSKALQQ